MDSVEVHITFIEHIADCIKMQKVINGDRNNFLEEQGIIDRTVTQLEEMSKEHRNKNKRSLAQKSKGMYDEHSQQVETELSRFTGSKDEKGSY